MEKIGGGKSPFMLSLEGEVLIHLALLFSGSCCSCSPPGLAAARAPAPTSRSEAQVPLKPTVHGKTARGPLESAAAAAGKNWQAHAGKRFDLYDGFDSLRLRIERPSMARVIYSPRYNIGFFGFERLHPFDSRKYGRTWKLLRQHFGPALREAWIRPQRPVQRDELLLTHTTEYLSSLKDPNCVARALELPFVKQMPTWLIDRCILSPMRWATMGTMLAANASLEDQLAVNLGGGFHHAKPNGGEGFCIYSDIGIAVANLRATGSIDENSRIVYVDTDAHQGNGVCHVFRDDPRVFIFDIYNSGIYPLADTTARDRIDCRIGINSSCTDREYLAALRDQLPAFLDSVTNQPTALAIYNAGTDVVADDPLGDLALSDSAVLERDALVVGELASRGLPTVMLLSGGYTKRSYQLIASSLTRLLSSDLKAKP